MTQPFHSTPTVSPVVDDRPRIDSAQLRCVRLGLGMRDVELAALVGVEHRSVSAWEDGRPVPAFVLDRLAPLIEAAAREVITLIEGAQDSGLIATFGSNAATSAGTGGAISFEGVHRVCAGRAAIAVPGARVIKTTTSTDGDSVVDADLLCRAAACGLGLSHLPRFLGMPKRSVQYWVTGKRPAPDWALEAVGEVAVRARAHSEALAATAAGGVIEVCATAADLARLWPDCGVPLPTHQVAAARAAAAADSGVALRFTGG